MKPSEVKQGRKTASTASNFAEKARKGDAEEKVEAATEVFKFTAVGLLALCGLSSLLGAVGTVIGAKPLSAQFFLGIVGAYCIPLAFLLWKDSVSYTHLTLPTILLV